MLLRLPRYADSDNDEHRAITCSIVSSNLSRSLHLLITPTHNFLLGLPGQGWRMQNQIEPAENHDRVDSLSACFFL